MRRRGFLFAHNTQVRVGYKNVYINSNLQPRENRMKYRTNHMYIRLDMDVSGLDALSCGTCDGGACGGCVIADDAQEELAYFSANPAALQAQSDMYTVDYDWNVWVADTFDCANIVDSHSDGCVRLGVVDNDGNVLIAEVTGKACDGDETGVCRSCKQVCDEALNWGHTRHQWALKWHADFVCRDEVLPVEVYLNPEKFGYVRCTRCDGRCSIPARDFNGPQGYRHLYQERCWLCWGMGLNHAADAVDGAQVAP